MLEPTSNPRLFCFGLGYSATRLARGLIADGWTVAGTCQSADRRDELAAVGIEAFVFDRNQPLADPAHLLSGVTHLLSSVPPADYGDPVLPPHGGDIQALQGLQWAGYLSSTGVYGNADGAKVDETSPVNPSSDRSRRRAEAEIAWMALRESHGLPVHVFRLAGIYGPGHSALDQVRAGGARRIEKPGHKFSRIHVDDIAVVLRASMARPHSGSGPGAVYNVCDDEAASPADVTAYACELLGQTPPPVVLFEDAKKEMSPMGLSFWKDNRRIDNRRIKDDLGATLTYPDYRAGLSAILAEGG
ncbi:MAG TPA: SDR family oxidoreductase [Rhodospirillales bacterium]|jgi:nucleoside-diphosphate-sugar epimerase|nr:SDR family oxidoreductase [Rhodospirillales bacterium]